MDRLVFALAGPIVWFLLFSALYAIETLACTPAVGLSGTPYGQSAGGAVIAAAVLMVAIGVSQFAARRRSRDPVTRLGLLLTGLSAIAAAWTALPIWVMGSCAA
jgi:hypothetical protein